MHFDTLSISLQFAILLAGSPPVLMLRIAVSNSNPLTAGSVGYRSSSPSAPVASLCIWMVAMNIYATLNMIKGSAWPCHFLLFKAQSTGRNLNDSCKSASDKTREGDCEGDSCLASAFFPATNFKHHTGALSLRLGCLLRLPVQNYWDRYR